MAKKAPKKEASASKKKKTANKLAVKSNVKPSVKSASVSTSKESPKVLQKATVKSETPRGKVPLKAAPKVAKKTAATKLQSKVEPKPAKSKKPSQGVVDLVEKVKVAQVEVSEPASDVPKSLSKAGKAKASGEKKSVAKVSKKSKKSKAEKLGLSDDQAKWTDLFEKHKAVKAPSYSITGQFEAKTPIEHKLFGWGFVLSNEYDRLEVLFKDGKRMLISNRKLS